MSKTLFLWLYLPPLILVSLRVLSYFALPDRRMKYRTIQEVIYEHSGFVRKFPAWLMILMFMVIPFVNLIVAIVMLVSLTMELITKWRQARQRQQVWNKQNRAADTTAL